MLDYKELQLLGVEIKKHIEQNTDTSKEHVLNHIPEMRGHVGKYAYRVTFNPSYLYLRIPGVSGEMNTGLSATDLAYGYFRNSHNVLTEIAETWQNALKQD